MDSSAKFDQRTYWLIGVGLVGVSLILPSTPEWNRTRSLGFALGVGAFLVGVYKQAQIGISLSRLGIGLPDIVGGRIVPGGKAVPTSTQLLA